VTNFAAASNGSGTRDKLPSLQASALIKQETIHGNRLLAFGLCVSALKYETF